MVFREEVGEEQVKGSFSRWVLKEGKFDIP